MAKQQNLTKVLWCVQNRTAQHLMKCHYMFPCIILVQQVPYTSLHLGTEAFLQSKSHNK